MSPTTRQPPASPTFAAIAVAAFGVLISIGGALYPHGGVIEGLALTAIMSLLAFIYCKRRQTLPAARARVDGTGPAGGEPSRGDLRVILDAMPAMIAYWDRDLINRFANRANELCFGVRPGEMTGQHLRALIGEELFKRELTHIEAALRGETRTFEQSTPQRDGSGYRHTLTHYVPDVDGSIVHGFYVLVYDVSELTESRLRLAGAVRENEELLRTLDLHSKVSITDDKGYITHVNENFCRILGYHREEVLGQPHSIINSGLQNRDYWRDMWGVISGGRAWRGEICNRAKDGTLHWVDAIIAPFLGNDGRVQKYVSIGTNITAAKSTEHRLRDNEAFLDRIGTLAGVGGWEFDLGTRQVTWSPQTYRIHEVDSAYEPRPDAEIEFYAPEARPAFEKAIAVCVKNGDPWDLELPAITAKGRAIWVRTVGSRELGTGKAVRLTGALQDITARKLAEVQLKESSERFAIAADSAGIGVWELDRSTRGLTWDDWMYRIHGITQTREVESYAFWTSVLHPGDRRRVESEVAAAFRGPRDFSSEFRIVRPDGEVRHIKAASRAIRGADGNSVKITGVNFDVTEARLREKVARRETASLLRTVLDSASEVSIIATDANLMIKVFNAGAERMLGFSSADVVGKHTLAKIHDESELESCREALSLRDGHLVDPSEALVDPTLMRQPHERHYVHKNGGRITVSLFITEMRSDEGTLLGYVCVAHDVTQQNKDQNTLLDAIAKADNANNAKSLFLANMSHEIRTPMNAVIGLSYLLTRTPLTVEQSSLLGKLQLAGNSLLSIITNILDLSKIEASELLVESTVFSLPDLLREVASVMSMQAEAKGIEFTLDAASELPEALTGDPTRLRQILVNLLSNAIRFTNRGSVRFTITPRFNGETGMDLSFTVADTGIGISPEAQQRLFAPFAQADPSISRLYGGTGLGLSIVKRLSNLLGGSVELESAVGIGSTFTVVLPFVPAASGALQAAREVTEAHVHGALHGIRALIVDDSDINLEVAKRILELDGVNVSFAIDGHEAFERLRAEPDAFDIVLMDVQMPILGGCEATRRIRAELGLLDLPIIAVTAGALNSERQRAKDAGMNDFICKPFNGPSLARSILKHIRPANLRHNALPPAATAPSPALDVAWPVILGIDTADARARWCGDTALFITMLARLFTEFDHIDFPVDSGDSDAMTAYVRLIHKLRGGACMLGARTLFAIAGEVETACIGAAYDTAAGLTVELTSEMQHLIENAQPALLAARIRNAPAVGRRRSGISAAH